MYRYFGDNSARHGYVPVPTSALILAHLVVLFSFHWLYLQTVTSLLASYAEVSAAPA